MDTEIDEVTRKITRVEQQIEDMVGEVKNAVREADVAEEKIKVAEEMKKVQQNIDVAEEKMKEALQKIEAGDPGLVFWQSMFLRLHEEKTKLQEEKNLLLKHLLAQASSSDAEQDAVDPFRRLIVEASLDQRIPEVTELKDYLLHTPRKPFPISSGRYSRCKSYLSKVDNFICCDPTRGVCWNLDDRLAILLRPPTTGSTESSYHAYWDFLVTEAISLFSLETLVLDRDTSRFSSSENKRPDKFGMVSRLALWRGEEKGPDAEGDPKQELAGKLVWTYGELPYLLCYYANTEIVTYCALVHDHKRWKTEVVDLITVNLSVVEDRFLALLVGFNISKLLLRLSEAGLRLGAESDFFEYRTDQKTVLLGTGVDKIYVLRSTFEKVRRIYESIEDCPHAEQVKKVHNASLRFQMVPRCLAKSRARPEDELLRALINVAEALVWLHGKNLMHRDITWRNVLKNPSDNNWVLIDFDETTATPCGHAHELCHETHAPEMRRGCHDSSVDIWGIGYLIRSSRINNLSAGVRELQRNCLEVDPFRRPNAATCLERLKYLRGMSNMDTGMDLES